MKHLFFSLVLSSAAFATDYSWNNPNHSNWNISTNWTPNGIPNGATDTATFAIDFNTNLGVNVTGTYEVQSLTLGQNFTIFQGLNPVQLKVNKSITLDATATAGVTIDSPIEFITNSPITITNLSAYDLSLPAELSGTPDLIFAGGTTRINDFANSFSGTVTINPGTELAAYVQALSTNTVINNGLLFLDNFNNVGPVYGGTISGTGSVTIGLSPITLTAANSYTGGTTINSSSTLIVSADNNLGGPNGPITLEPNATLKTNGSFTINSNRVITLNASPPNLDATISSNGTLTIDGQIAGIGGFGTLNVSGSGATIALTNASNSQGANTLQDGVTLQVGSDGALGVTTQPGSGDPTLISMADNSTFHTTGTFTSGRTFQTSGSATIDVDGGTTLTLAGVLQNQGLLGHGSFIKEGIGTLILSGANTYTGGTTVSGGTLQVGADSNLGNAAGDITLSSSGTLRTTATFTSNRTFQTPDTGTLNVNGGTTVSAGVLQGTTTSLQGGVTNNASIVFDQAMTGTYSGVMSGSGSLTKSNTGTVILTGANTYSGGTTVIEPPSGGFWCKKSFLLEEASAFLLFFLEIRLLSQTALL